ncbi:MAG: zinc ribbon domain-containing protein [Elusimicrobiales bacterium]|nr:zinc ribbon domain-containing protein [Elusimicrobiales bacterium]
MSIYWNEFLETGVAELDESYQTLFARINSYTKDVSEDKFESGVYILFRSVDKYVQSHFPVEEEWLKKNEYPDYQIHLAQHEYFRNKFAAIKRKSSMAPGLVTEVHKDVVDWLMLHVSKDDKAWIAYLKRQKNPEPDQTSRDLTVCPKCGKRAGKGKYCAHCGFLMAIATCYKCGSPIITDGKFCTNCGTSLEHTNCRDCGAANKPEALFCSSCGAKLNK